MLRKIREEIRLGSVLLQFGLFKAVGQGLMMMVPLVAAKLFSEEQFGRYSLAKMVPFFFTTILLTSFQAPFIVYANQERAETGKVNRSFTVQCTFLAVSLGLFVVLSMGFGRFIMSLAQISRVELLSVGLSFIGLAVKVFFGNLALAMGQRIKDSLIELTFGGASVGAVVLLHLAGRISLSTVFLVYLVGGLAVVILFVRTFDLKMLGPLTFDRAYFKGIFDFARWTVFGVTAVYFINWGSFLVMRYFKVPIDRIGDYGLGYQVFKGLVVLTTVLTAYFLPFVSENINNSEKMSSYLNNKRPKILLLGTVLIVLIFFLTPSVVRVVYGGAYQQSTIVLRILLIAAFLALYSTFYTPVLNALKKYRVLQAINVVHVASNVVLSVVLIPRFGLVGAAVSTVLAYLLRVLIIEIYFRVRVSKALRI